MEPRGEYISVAKAREILGVTKAKMSQLIRDGVLKAVESPFDKRYKMILRADVEKLAEAPRPKKEAA